MSLMDLRVVRIKIYQPVAHYRVPFSFKVRHTYPLPPYSTIIGFFCNLLGIRNTRGEGEPDCEEFRKLKQIKIGICGQFESRNKEFIWFRNLSKEYHVKVFGSERNRYNHGMPEHPGGIQPVHVFTLNNVRLWIYLYHEDEVFLGTIVNAFDGTKRKDILHLGRAEDWIVVEKVDFIELEAIKKGYNFRKFLWIPEKVYPELKGFDFSKIDGLRMKIPSFYFLQNGRRCFYYETIKLNEGEIIASETGLVYYIDSEENVPVFLADLTKRKEEKREDYLWSQKKQEKSGQKVSSTEIEQLSLFSL